MFARRMAATSCCAILLAAGLIFGSGAVHGIDRLTVLVHSLSGANWQTGPLQVELDLAQPGVLSLQVSAEQLRLPPPFADARRARMRCPRAELRDGAWRCADASVRLEFAKRGALTFVAAIVFNPDDRALQLTAKRQPLAGGVIDFALSMRDEQFSLDARFTDVGLADAWQFAALFGVSAGIEISSGTLSGSARVRDAPRSRQASAQVQLQNVAFSDASGSQAGEAINALLALDANGTSPVAGAGWEFALNAEVGAGVVYINPLLIEVTNAPISAAARGHWASDGELRIDEASLLDPGALQLEASARLRTAGSIELRELTVDAPQQPLAALYERWLKPFAGAGQGADLRMQGQVAARLDWHRQDDAPARIGASVRLDEIDLGDTEGQFSVLGLSGELHWRSGESGAPVQTAVDTERSVARPSALAWRAAQVRALDLGSGALVVALQGHDIELREPLVISVLDGQVRIDRLRGRGMTTAQQHLEMQISLSPISLQRLSDHLAWLPLSGEISGKIPKLVLTRDRLSIDGDINMDLFEGRARIAGLEVTNPFSPLSRLHADLSVDGIDLGVLSRAFSFGQIEGRLDGEVRGLVLESWQPVAFDARFATPEDDTSRHRISQRAVDNLASLGGAQAVLSSTFLRFFEEFSYARLGLSCRLQDGVCEMGGVGAAEPGYYIVKGGGIPPRVDVVGFNRRVDWKTLLERLKAVSTSPGPIIR